MNTDGDVVLYGSDDGYTERVREALDGANVPFDEFNLAGSTGMVLPTVVVSHGGGSSEVFEGYGRIKREFLPRLD